MERRSPGLPSRYIEKGFEKNLLVCGWRKGIVINMGKVELKNIGIKNMVLLLIAGVLLLICAVPGIFETEKGEEKLTFCQQETAETVIQELPIAEQLETVLSAIEGVGNTEVMFLTDPGMEGVVIVAEGAKDPKVMQYISDAVEALFGIPKHKIIVLPMRRENGSK